MTSPKPRGSEKLLAAWSNRAISEVAVKEIINEFKTANIEGAEVFGGANPTGLSVELLYADDDIDRCGNDLSFWLRWQRKYGNGFTKPPKIIINGTPWPDLIRIKLDFGKVTTTLPGLEQLGGVLPSITK
jgi:hypothetical protein